MYRKDHILNETQRLARLIAKLLGLKNQPDGEEEAQRFYNNTLQDEFGLPEEDLLLLELADFKAWLQQQKFDAVKLDALAQLLYHEAEPFTAEASKLNQLKKVLVIFDVLEQEHHMQSFENISKRNIIQQYLPKQHG
jgi:hypothetical protein